MGLLQWLSAGFPTRDCSSIGQSIGLSIRRLPVQVRSVSLIGLGRTRRSVAVHSLTATSRLGHKQVRTREKTRWVRNLQLKSRPNHYGKRVVDTLSIVVVLVNTITDPVNYGLGHHKKIKQSGIFLDKRVDCLPI